LAGTRSVGIVTIGASKDEDEMKTTTLKMVNLLTIALLAVILALFILSMFSAAQTVHVSVGWHELVSVGWVTTPG